MNLTSVAESIFFRFSLRHAVQNIDRFRIRLRYCA